MARGRWVSFSVRVEVYRRLREFMEAEGIVSISDAIRLLLERYTVEKEFTDRIGELEKRFTDLVGELINKFTGGVGEFTGPIGESGNKLTGKQAKTRRTMLDIIREKKVQLLSEDRKDGKWKIIE